MNFIKHFFSGGLEDWVHVRFVRYGRGVFDGPAAGVKVGKTIKVSGSEEYCNVLGFVVVCSCPGSFIVSGSITGKSDFRSVLRDAGVEFKDKSKKGFFSVEVSGELSSDVLKDIYSSAGEAYVLLSLKSEGGKEFSLKCKKKLPKPGGKKDADFVAASLGASALSMLKDEVFFDVDGGFSEARLGHRYNITDILVPEGVKDPSRVRLESKRKGFVERKLVVDGMEKVSRVEFTV